MGESQAQTGAGNKNFVNIGEDQGLTLESRETQCLVISASGELQRERIRFPGDR